MALKAQNLCAVSFGDPLARVGRCIMIHVHTSFERQKYVSRSLSLVLYIEQKTIMTVART